MIKLRRQAQKLPEISIMSLRPAGCERRELLRFYSRIRRHCLFFLAHLSPPSPAITYAKYLLITYHNTPHASRTLSFVDLLVSMFIQLQR
eukprot:scaffold2326_cov140-Skeletonema_menzelii.AAC.2